MASPVAKACSCCIACLSLGSSFFTHFFCFFRTTRRVKKTCRPLYHQHLMATQAYPCLSTPQLSMIRQQMDMCRKRIHHMRPLHPTRRHFRLARVWDGILRHRATSAYAWYSHFQCCTLNVRVRKAHSIVVSVHRMEPVHHHNWTALLVQWPRPSQRHVVVVLLACHLVAPFLLTSFVSFVPPGE